MEESVTVVPGPKPTAKRRGRPPKKRAVLDPAEFVRVYRDAEGIDDVAKKVGTDREHVIQFAAYLRRRGVELRRFNRPTLDVNALNAIARGDAE